MILFFRLQIFIVDLLIWLYVSISLHAERLYGAEQENLCLAYLVQSGISCDTQGRIN